MQNSQIWTPEIQERLAALAGERLSASQIAERLSQEFGRRFTRSSVIGRLSRSKIPLSGNFGAPKKVSSVPKQKPSPVFRAAGRIPNGKPPPPAQPITRRVPKNAAEYDATGLGLPLMEVPIGCCKWAITPFEARVHRFCALPVDDAKGVYCAEHRRRATAINYRGDPLE